MRYFTFYLLLFLFSFSAAAENSIQLECGAMKKNALPHTYEPIVLNSAHPTFVDHEYFSPQWVSWSITESHFQLGTAITLQHQAFPIRSEITPEPLSHIHMVDEITDFMMIGCENNLPENISTASAYKGYCQVTEISTNSMSTYRRVFTHLSQEQPEEWSYGNRPVNENFLRYELKVRGTHSSTRIPELLLSFSHKGRYNALTIATGFSNQGTRIKQQTYYPFFDLRSLIECEIHPRTL
tara:strand:+ start:83875 stop:84591 length:717 start_codon:yes stop_codon:yes gene_type:complete